VPRFRNVRLGDLKNQATSRQKITDPKRTSDAACHEVLCIAEEQGAITAFQRYVAQQPQCGFGLTGICCRNCIQGPCRISSKSEANQKGICGASDYTIVARNYARLVAGGASCHSQHGHHVAKTVLKMAEGKAPDYKVSDPQKLAAVARQMGIETEGKSDRELVREVALAALNDYHGFTDDPPKWLWNNITEGRRKKFKHCDILPTAIDRAVVEIMDQTTMGMDSDPVNIVFGALKTSLVDFTGMHITTDLSDILFGTPRPIKTEANLGVLDKEYVNIAVHGHNPTLSEMIVEAAEQLQAEARSVGAKGIKVCGICCTGNELLMRQGVALAGNQASQELAVLTGVLDAMVVDVQCIMPALKPLSECFHTRFITTSETAKIPSSYHFDFQEEHALETAKEMVRLAISAFRERDENRVRIPSVKNEAIAGFSREAIYEILSATNPENPVRVINDAILSGEILGVCLFAGCNNLRITQDESHVHIAKELAKHNVLMLATGCAAGAFAKSGLLTPAAVDAYAGEGLKSFLKRVGGAAGLEMPLVLHMGSCVDNTRAMDLCTDMANDLGVDVPKVPFAASAPEAMHEKAVSIGSWCVAMGLPVHVGVMPPLEGSQLVYGIATQIAHDVYGGHFILEQDPAEGARKIIDALEYRVWKLKIHRAAAEKYETPVAVHW